MSHVNLDETGKRVGMWLFLLTELVLFGGLFVLYAVYLSKYPEAFASGGAQLDTKLGALNTVLLLLSSFTVAASITALQRHHSKTSLALLSGTLLFAAAFLINKYFEWGHKIAIGLYPNGKLLGEKPHGEQIFFGLYYMVTGLHGLHVILGSTLLIWAAVMIAKRKVTAQRHTLLENAGLYWHLVDLIWIFVFPLFYLVV